MAQHLDRHASCDRDGRRVEQLAGLGADEGRADHAPAGAVDHQLRTALDVVAQECGSGRGRPRHVRHLDVDLGGSGLRLGQADGSDLRVREDDLRDGYVVGYERLRTARCPRGDLLAEDAGAVLAPVRQRRLAAGVADEDEPGRYIAGARLVGIETDRVQPDAVEARASTHSNEDLVAGDVAAVGRDDHSATVDAPEAGVLRVVATTPGHRDPDPYIDPQIPQSLEHDLARERFDASEQPVVPAKERDRRAEGAHPHGGLEGDHAATDDDETVGHLDHTGGCLLYTSDAADE